MVVPRQEQGNSGNWVIWIAPQFTDLPIANYQPLQVMFNYAYLFIALEKQTSANLMNVHAFGS